MNRHATAALLDLDNILHTGSSSDPDCEHYWATAEEADAIVSWALRHVRSGGATFILGACAHATLKTYLGIAQFPHQLHTRLAADGVKDAADHLLLAEGIHLIERGFRHFYLASGDGAFADFAELPQVSSTVLAYDRPSLSRRLELSSPDVRIYTASEISTEVLTEAAA